MGWMFILERKVVQAREREGKGNSASKLFSNNADLRRPTFENSALVKEFFFFSEMPKFSSGVQLCWNIPCVYSSVVSVEKRKREKTDQK